MSYNPHSDNPFNPQESKRRIFKNRSQNLCYSVFVVAMVCVVLFCGFVFVEKHFSDYITQKSYEEWIGEAPTPNPSRESGGFSSVPFPSISFNPSEPVVPQRPTTQYVPTKTDKDDGYVNRENQVWDVYEGENPDIRGWLYIPEVVNYPFFMDDNDYYLTHDKDHRESDAGALFMSSLNSLNPLGPNTIIHGHNMTNESMFGKLKYYTTFGTQAFFENHQRVYLDTLYGTFRFEVFSVYITHREDPDYRSHYFGSEDAYLEYLNRIRDRGLFKDTSFEFTPYDRILTLSTCNSDEGSTKRTIVHARLVWPNPNTQNKPELLPTTPAPTVGPSSTADPNQTVDPNVTVTPEATPDVSNLRVVKLNDPTVPLKLRSAASTSSDIIDTLDHGTVLTVLEDLDDWIRVKVGDKEGYVYKMYTVAYKDFDFGDTPTPTAPPTTAPSVTPTVQPEDTPSAGVTDDPNPEDTTSPEVTDDPNPEDTTSPDVTDDPNPEDTPSAGVTDDPNPEDTTSPEVTDDPNPEDTTSPEVTDDPNPEDTTSPDVTDDPNPEDTTSPEVTDDPNPEDTTSPDVTDPDPQDTGSENADQNGGSQQGQE